MAPVNPDSLLVEDALWAEILIHLYESGRTTENELKTTFSEEDYPETEIDQSIRSLLNWGHLEEDAERQQGTRREYHLSEQGFKVAHELKLSSQEQKRETQRDRRQHKVNRGIAFLTLGLVLIGAVQATVTGLVGKDASLEEVNLAIGLGVVVVVVLGLILRQADMLAGWDKI